MKVEIIIETPVGQRLGLIERWHPTLNDAIRFVSHGIAAGESIVVNDGDFLVLLSSSLLQQSVIKFRDVSDDKDVPF